MKKVLNLTYIYILVFSANHFKLLGQTSTDVGFEKKYEKGAYKSVYKASSAQLKSQKSALNYIYKAKAAEACAKYAEMDSLLNLGLAAYQGNTNTEEYTTALRLVADTWYGYGAYQKSTEYYQKSLENYQNLKGTDSVFKFDLKLNIGKSLLKQGFNNEAFDIVNEQFNFRLSKIGKANLTDKTPNEVFKKLPKSVRKSHIASMAKTLALRDAAWLNRGEFRLLDSNLTKDYTWVKKNNGKSSIESRDLLVIQAKKYEVEKQKGKATSYYLKAFHKSKAKFSEKTVLDILEKVVYSYNAENDRHRARKYVRKLESALNLQYGRKSPQYIRYPMLDVATAFQFSKFNKSFKNLSKVYKGKIAIPQNHPLLAKMLLYSYDLDIKNSNYDQAKDSLEKLLLVKKYLFGEKSPEYHKTKLEWANFLAVYGNNFKKSQEIEDESWDKIVAPQYSPQNLEYTYQIQQLAGLYDLIDKYDMAIERLNLAATTIEKYYGKENPAYASALQKLAEEYIKKGDFKKGETLINEAVDLMKKVGTKENASNKAATYLTLSKLYTTIGNYPEAAKALKVAKKTSKKAKDSGAEDAAAKSTDELADFYIKNGRYNDAENLLDRTLFLKEKRFGKENKELIATLNQMSALHLIKGNYGSAEKSITRSTNLTSKIFGDSSIKYTETIKMREDLLKKIGEFVKAEESAVQRLQIQRKNLGNNHIELASTYSNIAMLRFFSSKDVSKSIGFVNNGLQIVKNNIGTENPQYATQITNLATFYIELKQYDKADSLLNVADAVWKKLIGLKNVNSADIAMLRGAIDYKQEKYSEAKSNFLNAKILYASIFSKQHPGYVKASSRLAHTYFVQKEYNKSLSIMDEITKTYLTYTRKYFPSLSFNEKAKYWNLIKDDFEFYNSLALKLKDAKPELIGKMYDMTMATKAIMLSSSIKVRERIMNSKDEQLINRYNDWIGKKEFLSSIISLSNESLKEMGVNVPQLEKEINIAEKELSESSEIFASNNDKKFFHWTDVKSKLKDNENAVEILRFRNFTTNFTDEPIYAALIINKLTSKKPALVIFDNGKELETRYLKYYRNATKNRVDDAYSYDKYWSPIKQKIADGSTIYMSAEGVFNQVNVEAMMAQDNSFAIDKNDFIFVSNTKDIIINTEKERRPNGQIAVLVGNPTFYASIAEPQKSEIALPARANPNDRGVTNTTPVKKPTKKSDVIAKDLQRDFQSNTEISQLPGTEEEVNNLEGYLLTKNWTVKKYMENNAVEDTVKAIRQPKVFHIATHGFFKEDVGEEEVSGLSASEAEFTQNPLLRSGLLLKGAGDVLKSNSILDINSEKGVLTAYEAMNMNLDNTELVVLSACETGLGQVQVGEGVFGLQRSFLVAGANTVIMSLFKVNDEVTQKLMTRFYELWLKTGDKRKSFADAKREIKKIYPEPIFWGSFVMSGI